VACRTAPPTTTDSPSALAATSAAVVEPQPRIDATPLATRTTLSATRVATDHGVVLVKVDHADAAADDALPLVTITRAELLVGTDVVAQVQPGPLGFDATIKRAGNWRALQLLPLEAALTPIHAAAPSGHTLRLLIDAGTSYRSALEVLFTAAQAGFTSFAFVVSTEGGERSLPASTPTRGEREVANAGGGPPAASFVLEPTGVAVSVGGVALGSGCTKDGKGVAVPARAGKLDATAIAACAARVKASTPLGSQMTVAEVSASASLDAQTVLTAVGALLPSLRTVHFGLLSQ